MSAAQHDGAVIGNTKDRTNKKVKAENGWKYRTAYFKNSNGDTYKINISIAQDGEIELAYSIGKPINKKRTADGNALSGGDMGSKATSAIPSNSLPQPEAVVNSYSMQNIAEDAGGSYSLMEDAQYMADLDKAVAEATAKSEEALNAAQAEGKELRRPLLDDSQQATAEAKMNDRRRDAETKLVAALAVSHNDHLP